MTNKNLKSARQFARLMDSRFSIFGFRFGLDSILGLIPGAGDVIGMLLSLYLIWIGIQMKIPSEKLIQMILNIAIDTTLGSVPILGDVADFIYKANTKNLRILEEYEDQAI